MNSIFKLFLRKFVLVFFDDILIHNKYWEEHVQHVDRVLQLLEYLGHIVSHEGVKVDPNKIKIMREWSIPKTLKKLRVFLGLTRYYHNFFKNYGQIATPLTTLLNNEIFSWT
jgi:hypothetical protein